MTLSVHKLCKILLLSSFPLPARCCSFAAVLFVCCAHNVFFFCFCCGCPAKSKQKIIDKMEEAGLTEKVVEDVRYDFAFPQCEPLPPPVLVFQKVGFAYSGEMKDALYTGLELGVDMESRIALVGPNGAGQ
jgi:ABC-type multidrug transport system fused ATPase/permease subunit